MLIVGIIVFGKGFGFKTIYCSLLLSITLNVLEAVVPITQPFTDEPMLELFFDMVLVSLGAAFIFNEEGSSGGTDIIAMILKKYTQLNIGKALFVVDLCVILGALVVFNIEIALFSLLAITIRALVIDNAMDGFNASRFFLIAINKEKEKEITQYILEELERGATLLNDCSGAYTKQDKVMIVTVVDRRQAVLLRHKVKQIDSTAFTIVGTSSDIFGDGFKMS